MKRTSTCLLILCLGISAFAQWSPFASGFFSNRDMTIKDGTYYMISYPMSIQSTDDFSTWTPVNNGIALSAGNIFAESLGHNDSYLFCGTHSGVYRSDDAGANWTLSNGTLPFSTMIYVKKFFEFNGDMYVVMNNDIANGGGVYISQDNGANWFGTNGGLTSNTIINDIFELNGTLYASTNVGLFSSTDWGGNWVQDTHFNYAVHAFYGNDDALVVSSLLGMERSTNGGSTWTTVTGPSGLASAELTGYGTTVHLAARGGTDAGLWISGNGGQTWAMNNTGIGPADVPTTYQFYLSDTHVYLGAITDSYSYERQDVGISERNSLDGFNASFLPSEEAIRIFSEEIKPGTEAKLFDLTGRTLRTIQLNGLQTDLDASTLNAGIYIVLITRQGLELPIKVVVN